MKVLNVILLILIVIMGFRIFNLQRQFTDLESRLELLEDESIDSMVRAYGKDNGMIYDL